MHRFVGASFEIEIAEIVVTARQDRIVAVDGGNRLFMCRSFGDCFLVARDLLPDQAGSRIMRYEHGYLLAGLADFLLQDGDLRPGLDHLGIFVAVLRSERDQLCL